MLTVIYQKCFVCEISELMYQSKIQGHHFSSYSFISVWQALIKLFNRVCMIDQERLIVKLLSLLKMFVIFFFTIFWAILRLNFIVFKPNATDKQRHLHQELGTNIKYQSQTSNSGILWGRWLIGMSPTCKKYQQHTIFFSNI